MPRLFRPAVLAACVCLLFALAPQIGFSQPARETAEERERGSGELTNADIPRLEQESAESYESGDYVRFYIANRKLSKLRPYEPRYLYNMVRACALIGRHNTAYHYMLKMQQQGLSYDFNATEDTANIRGTEAYEHINDLMIEAGKPAGEGEVVHELAIHPAQVHAMAWDPTRRKLLLGTLRRGSVLAVDQDGSSEILLEADDSNGLWSVTGLEVDPERSRLWVSSSAIPVFEQFQPSDMHHGSLFEFDLRTLELLGRYNVPVDGLAHELGSIALTADGHVYVIDRATPIVYRKTPEGRTLQPYFASGELVALRDIAVAADHSRLFVSDAELGIVVVVTATEQTLLLSGPETINLGGIEGIEFADGELYIVQSDIQPQRLMRLELDDSGTLVTKVSPMAIALEPFDGLGFATRVDDDLYYFANSWTREEDAKTRIMRTPLNAGTEIVPPDMRKLREHIESGSGEQQAMP